MYLSERSAPSRVCAGVLRLTSCALVVSVGPTGHVHAAFLQMASSCAGTLTCQRVYSIVSCINNEHKGYWRVGMYLLLNTNPINTCQC